MRKLLSVLLVLCLSFAFFMQTADAARFGGGRSFGAARSVSSFRSASSPLGNAARPAASKWGGPLAGFLAGGLLASLFMGHGIGSGIMTWLGIICIGMLAFSFLRNRLQPAPSYSQTNTNAFTANPMSSAPVDTTPVGFDSATFLRNAKVQFIRLQAAYDSKNLADIREFCSPEVFGEIQLQLQERGEAANQTEVVTLNALLLDTTTEMQNTIASVEFSGLIKENPNDAATQFNEVWHFSKNNMNEHWIVTGVQQN